MKPAKISDGRLTARILELREAHRAIEAELSSLVGEYQQRRRDRVAAGEPAQRRGEEGVLVGDELTDSLRREELAAAHRKADEMARKDLYTSGLLLRP